MTEKKEKEPPNLVKNYAIFNEQIRKELRFHRISENFSFNPFSKPQFIKSFQRANLEPVRKYAFPQTEAQEIGWITQPLVRVDRTDYRLFHPRLSCEITRVKEDEFKRLGKQT